MVQVRVFMYEQDWCSALYLLKECSELLKSYGLQCINVPHMYPIVTATILCCRYHKPTISEDVLQETEKFILGAVSLAQARSGIQEGNTQTAIEQLHQSLGSCFDDPQVEVLLL